jgi:transcriptional regulator with XRE-family HTH domain
MPTDEELEQRRRRRAYWMRRARESRGLGQAGVAELLKMSPRSASTVGDWERLVSDPSLRQLEMMAAIYGVPLSLFVDPPETDEERLVALARAAIELERQDSEAEEGQDPDADDGPDAPPGRRSP